MTASFLIAKLSVVAVLATYVPLFLGIGRGRQVLAAMLVVAAAMLLASSAVAAGGAATLATALQDRTLLVVGGLAAALALLATLTLLAWRFPAWALPAVIAVMPLRIPLPVGERSAYLLVPLYLSTLAVLIAEVVIRDRLRPAPAGPAALPAAWHDPPDPLRLSLALFMVVAGLSVFWAGSGWGAAVLGAEWRAKVLAAGLVELLAFLLPFGIVTLLTFRYVADGAGLRRILLTVIGGAVVMAVIGIVQYPTRWLVFNRAGIMDDYALGNGFRVNSLFWDPNMFSRFLIVALLLSIALLVAVPVWRRRLAAATFLLAGANLLTLSRSGWIAFAVGFVVFAFAWLGRRRGVMVAGAAVVALMAVGGLLLAARGVNITRAKLTKPWGVNKLTGGRLYLGEAALKMAADHPSGGVGYGVFSLAYPQYRNRHASKKLTESHTTPLTMLAELGVPGLIVFLAVVWAAFDTAFRRRRLHNPLLAAAPIRAGPGFTDSSGASACGTEVERGAQRDASGRPVAQSDGRQAADAHRLYLVRSGLGAALAAILVHSLLYNAFFQDPYVWFVFGLLLATAYRLAGWHPYDRSR